MDLEAVGEWFQEKGIESVAIVSTGIYWIPIFSTFR
jgi:hypothetical protein